jgi:methyltransferase (TIGR00027 family)
VPRLNLAHQRKRARALLKAARTHSPDALRRLESTRTRAPLSSTVSLHHAQRVIAREHGFATWARLKAHARSEALRNPFMRSALVGAANRALETALARPLYRDPFAGHLAGDAGRSLLDAMRRASWPGYGATGPEPFLTVMTRFFDDALQQVVAESAIRQVVILNAGLDTRAYRLAWPSAVTLFEVDRSDVFEHMKAVLDRVGARATCRRQVVAAGLHGWARALSRAGFDARTPAAFLVEGLQHLDPSAADRLLRDVTAVSSPGSWIGLVLTTEQTRCSAFMTPYLQKMESLGFPPWRFGVDDPDAWLATYGWDAVSVVAGAPEASYGRFPYAHVPRGTPAIPRAFFTQGRRRGQEEGRWRDSR